ncbi:hypothetical protein CH60_145 [Yersinia pestis str. Pestoides B]|nr:hypothetical protein CH60_145 [Yersinia pestis str. Pestoides B]
MRSLFFLRFFHLVSHLIPPSIKLSGKFLRRFSTPACFLLVFTYNARAYLILVGQIETNLSVTA